MHHLYTCSAYESEKVRVEQVLRKLVLINLRKGVIHQRCWRRSSINGAGVVHPWRLCQIWLLWTNLLCNVGKPRIHLNPTLWFTNFISLKLMKCYIRWLGVEWYPNWCITNLDYSISSLIPVFNWKCLVCLTRLMI
jgi:hypothetical protein